MELDTFIQNQESYLKSRTEYLSNELTRYPEGKLCCYPNGTNYSLWLTFKNKKRRYVAKTDTALIQMMLDKRLIEAELQDCRMQLAACSQYLKTIKKNPANEREKILGNEAFLRCLKRMNQNTETPNWSEEPYEKNPNFPEGLTVPTITGEKVRSKSESLCVQMLVSMKIPFRYEEKHNIGGYEYYPDFTVLRPRDHSIVLIEIFGMMDDVSYMNRTLNKLKTYISNGYVPDYNLLCFYETNAMPLDVKLMQMKLEYFLK